MTNKELFCEIVKKAHKQNDAICKLETALGGVVIEEENLFSIFNKSDEICGFLLWGNEELPDWYYEIYWDFVLNGYTKYFTNKDEEKTIETAEDFYDFLKGQLS